MLDSSSAVTFDPYGSLFVVSHKGAPYRVFDARTTSEVARFHAGYLAWQESAYICTGLGRWFGISADGDQINAVDIHTGAVVWRSTLGDPVATCCLDLDSDSLLVVSERGLTAFDLGTGATLRQDDDVRWIWPLNSSGVLLVRSVSNSLSIVRPKHPTTNAVLADGISNRVLSAAACGDKILVSTLDATLHLLDFNGRELASPATHAWIPRLTWSPYLQVALGFGSTRDKSVETLVSFDAQTHLVREVVLPTIYHREHWRGWLGCLGKYVLLDTGHIVDLTTNTHALVSIDGRPDHFS